MDCNTALFGCCLPRRRNDSQENMPVATAQPTIAQPTTKQSAPVGTLYLIGWPSRTSVIMKPGGRYDPDRG